MAIKLSAFVCHTNGKGFWSNEAREVHLRHMEQEEYGEIRVYFTKKSWNPKKYGLIYTDPLFIKELRILLQVIGFTQKEAMNINYSEQGMQGDNYVSLDAGSDFFKGMKRVEGK